MKKKQQKKQKKIVCTLYRLSGKKPWVLLIFSSFFHPKLLQFASPTTLHCLGNTCNYYEAASQPHNTIFHSHGIKQCAFFCSLLYSLEIKHCSALTRIYNCRIIKIIPCIVVNIPDYPFQVNKKWDFDLSTAYFSLISISDGCRLLRLMCSIILWLFHPTSNVLTAIDQKKRQTHRRSLGEQLRIVKNNTNAFSVLPAELISDFA